MTPLDLSAYIALVFCYLFAGYVCGIMCFDLWRAWREPEHLDLPDGWKWRLPLILGASVVAPWSLAALALWDMES